MKEPRLLLRRRGLKRERLNAKSILLTSIQKSPERILIPQRRSDNELTNAVV